jgi:hypothetical protein
MQGEVNQKTDDRNWHGKQNAEPQTLSDTLLSFPLAQMIPFCARLGISDRSVTGAIGFSYGSKL